MSAEKHEQLVEAGRIDPDTGQRIRLCPTCGKPGFVPPDGPDDAVVTPDAVVAGHGDGFTPAEGGAQ